MTRTTFADFVADNIPVLCWMAEADGGIHWFNQSWYDYTGSTPEEMDGWGWRERLNPDSLSEVLIEWTAGLAAKKPFKLMVPLRGADGSYRTFLTHVRPTLRDGWVVSWFGTNTDVSDLIEDPGDMTALLPSVDGRTC